MARQLGESSAPCLDAYRDGRQRWRHALAIREHYGFRNLEEDTAAGFRLTRWLYVLCWTGDDRPGLLFDRATTWLLAHKVLLPGITTLERLISRVRYHSSRDGAKLPFDLAVTIPRDCLRPQYGDGFLGAPLLLCRPSKMRWPDHGGADATAQDTSPNPQGPGEP